MARSSPKWVWSVLFRDNAPRDKSVNKSVVAAMHTLHAFADTSGGTFVGQARLAYAACMTGPTLRQALEIAWRAQWVGVTHARFVGKKWRHYEYRLCIPDHLDLAGLTIQNADGKEISFQELVDLHCEQYGPVDTDTHPDKRKVGKPLSQLPGKTGDKKREGGKIPGNKVGKNFEEGGKIPRNKVGKPLSPKSQSEEVPILSSNIHKHASDVCVVDNFKTFDEALSPNSPRITKPGDDPLEARQQRCAKFVEVFPEIENAKLEIQFRLTAEQVIQLRTIQ